MVERHVQAAPYFEISERSAEVARIVRDDEVAGSIPAAPTKEKCGERGIYLPTQEQKVSHSANQGKLKILLVFPAYRFKSVHKPADPTHQMVSLCFDSAQHPEPVEWVESVVGVTHTSLSSSLKLRRTRKLCRVDTPPTKILHSPAKSGTTEDGRGERT